MVNFPASQDDTTSIPDPGSGNYTDNPSHAGLHDLENAAIRAIETKVGIGASTPTAGTIFRGTGTGTSAWGAANLATDITGILPVVNGGTGLTVLTIPASAILVGTTDVQDVTNKTLHDTFMGETFMSQSATFRNVVLDASVNYLIMELIEVGAAFSLEIPATSTLEIHPFPGTQSFTNAQHDHSSAAGGGLLGNKIVTAAKMGTPYTCSLYKTGNQTLTSGSDTVVTWEGEVFDTGSLHDTVTNNSRVTVPTGFDGYWMVRAELKTTGGSSGNRLVSIRKNGVQWRLNRTEPVTSNDTSPQIFDILQCSAGDYIEIYLFVDGGTNVTLQGGAPPLQDWSSFVVSFLGSV